MLLSFLLQECTFNVEHVSFATVFHRVVVLLGIDGQVILVKFHFNISFTLFTYDLTANYSRLIIPSHIIWYNGHRKVSFTLCTFWENQGLYNYKSAKHCHISLFPKIDIFLFYCQFMFHSQVYRFHSMYQVLSHFKSKLYSVEFSFCVCF